MAQKKDVNGARRREPTFQLLVEHERNAPGALGNRFATAATSRPAGGGALHPVETREPSMLETVPGLCLEVLSIDDLFFRFVTKKKRC